ncbi:MAG: CHASE domain-containing protein, partial [Opitutales bacterium]
MPRRSWLERTSLLLASFLVLLGAGALAGWWLHLDVLIQPLPGFAPISANASLCFFLLGCALLGQELESPRTVVGCAVPPAVLAALTLAEYILRADLKIDELLTSDHLLVDTVQSGRMSIASSCCLLLAALVLVSRGLSRNARAQVSTEAVVGSLVGSVGFSTLLGYVTSLPAVYSWGTNSAIPPVTGFALLLLGSALLLLAWREALRAEGGPPRWAPMPAVIACFTLTFILWIGLGARENTYIGVRTQTSMEGLATTINYELDRQKSLVERLANNWGNSPETTTIVRETDAHLQMDELRQFGCVSLGWVTPDLRTGWVYPRKDNEGALNFNHRSDEIRLRALEEARSGPAAVVSGTIDISGHGKGFVIYAPVTRTGQLAGYVAAEFLYRPFFTGIIFNRKLASDYHVIVTLGTEPLYDSEPGATSPDGGLTLEKTYPIFNRRIRLTFTPSGNVLANDRRFLPELTLVAGIGITLLLGLSGHLARKARTGQHTAELSNQKLVAENEERRRVEERLKVSDERLRLALDSTRIGIFEWNVPAGQVYY